MPLFGGGNRRFNQGPSGGGGQQAQPAFKTFQSPNPRAEGLFNLINQRGGGVQMFGGALGAAGLSNLIPGAEQQIPLGLSTLNDILLGRGQTDPALFNRQLADIGLSTQAQQTAQQGSLARQGLQRSGVGQAIGAAIGAHGGEQRAQAQAQETAIAEQRKRQDLNLLLSLLINPSLQASNIGLGHPTGASQGTDIGGILGGVGGLLQGASSFGGGGGGGG